MRRTRRRSLVAAVLALTMVVAACGEADDADSAAQDEEEPLALDLEESDEATEDEEEADEAEATEDDEASDEAAFDLEAAVADYASSIPEDFNSEGDTEAFKEALQVEEAVIIDVREEEEYAEGHIPGAINIPLRTVAENLDAIPTDRPVWTYCRTGWRANLVTSSLGILGYDNVTTYVPSAVGWEEAGEELVTEGNQPEDFGDPGFEPELVEAVHGFLSTVPDDYYTNSRDDVKGALAAGATMVDVREPGEYDEGHVPDAVSVPIRSIPANQEDVPTDSNVMVMCRSGVRAAVALPIFHVLGYTNAQGYPGSFLDWEGAGEPLTS
jgi:rhodanese-related sulfurtransferase